MVDGVPRAEGDRLRGAVLSHRALRRRRPRRRVAPEPPEEEFARFDNRWLLYAPLVGSYLALPVAAVGALLPAARRAAPAACSPTSTARLAGPGVAAVGGRRLLAGSSAR